MGGQKHTQGPELDADASDATKQSARGSTDLQSDNCMTELTTSDAHRFVHFSEPDTAIGTDKEGSSVRCLVWNCIPLVSEELAGVHLLIK